MSVFVRGDNPTPDLRRSAAILPCPTGNGELVGDNFPTFYGQHNGRNGYSYAMTDTTILHPSRRAGSRLDFEAEGVSPVYCGPNAREQALSYARQRAGYGRAEIQVRLRLL